MESKEDKLNAIMEISLNIEKRMTNLENRFNKFIKILGYKI